MTHLPKNAVVVFAKIPGRQNPKSRIASEVGKEKAGEIYRELLQTTALQVESFDHFIAFTGSGEPGLLRRLFPGARGFLAQQGDTLGLRVLNALHEVRAMGYDRVCALGTDCPALTTAEIEKAFSMLAEDTDAVLGPAMDGGYYLIALKTLCDGIFTVRGWGTGDLLYETTRFMRNNGIRYGLLAPREDIDTFDAYMRWKESVFPEDK
jgi:rSAM/selenodomain-associated transferase 1